MRFDSVLDEATIDQIKQYFIDLYGHEPNVSVVSPIVGQELVKNAIYALLIAFVGMIIYVTFRFELFFALTAIIALLHDVFFMLVVFSITRIEFDVTIIAAILTIIVYLFNNKIVLFLDIIVLIHDVFFIVFVFIITRIEFDVTIIAAILTIIGYSINNTIVVFDRIRENIRKKNKLIKSAKELATIINHSLIQTFMRSINTTLTTLIAVLSFLIFGASSISGFAIALVVGLVAGTYSSLFLASQLWLVVRGRNLQEKPIDFRKRKRVEGPQV